jgi:putative oxidoreductase
MSFEYALAPWQPRLLSVLRIVTGLEILQHGTSKILGFPSFPAFSNASLTSLLGASGLIELIGGSLFLIGLFTRPVAFILCGFTAVAYFMMHAPKSFFPLLNGGELAVLYCFVFLYFISSGPGPWSADAAVRGKI